MDLWWCGGGHQKLSNSGHESGGVVMMAIHGIAPLLYRRTVQIPE